MNGPMRVSAKADYAVRAAVELATQPPEVPVRADQIAVSQEIPLRFLENILREMRNNDLVESQLGAEAGYWLARPAAEITIADVIRSVEGQVGTVRGAGPHELTYRGSAKPLQEVWLALRANVGAVLETVTLADVVAGALPASVRALSEHPAAQ